MLDLILRDGEDWKRIFYTMNVRSQDGIQVVHNIHWNVERVMKHYAGENWTYQILFQTDDYQTKNHVKGLRLIFHKVDDLILAKLTAGDLMTSLMNGIT